MSDSVELGQLRRRGQRRQVSKPDYHRGSVHGLTWKNVLGGSTAVVLFQWNYKKKRKGKKTTRYLEGSDFRFISRSKDRSSAVCRHGNQKGFVCSDVLNLPRNNNGDGDCQAGRHTGKHDKHFPQWISQTLLRWSETMVPPPFGVCCCLLHCHINILNSVWCASCQGRISENPISIGFEKTACQPLFLAWLHVRVLKSIWIQLRENISSIVYTCTKDKACT